MNKHVAIASLVYIWAGIAHAGETVKLANLDWPPYSSDSMPNKGATSAVIERAFASVGLGVAFDFLPFNRAVLVGMSDPTFAGYTTEYYSREVNERCALSAPIGKSPVGFVQKLGDTFTWNTLDDLKPLVVGVVDGYVNDGAEFDAAVTAKTIKVEAVKDDLTVLRKVAAGRTPIGVVDANVVAYLQGTNKDLAGTLRMNGKLLKEHDLFVCFQKTPAGVAVRDKFNEGLAKLDLDGEYAAYFKANFK